MLVQKPAAIIEDTLCKIFSEISGLRTSHEERLNDMQNCLDKRLDFVSRQIYNLDVPAFVTRIEATEVGF